MSVINAGSFADFGPFMDYYSLFWGHDVVSMVNEPCGVFTCRSSTLAILAYSDLFLRILLTVLGSRSDFHRCWSSTLAVLTDSGPVLGLLLTVLGCQSDFHSC